MIATLIRAVLAVTRAAASAEPDWCRVRDILVFYQSGNQSEIGSVLQDSGGYWANLAVLIDGVEWDATVGLDDAAVGRLRAVRTSSELHRELINLAEVGVVSVERRSTIVVGHTARDHLRASAPVFNGYVIVKEVASYP